MFVGTARLNETEFISLEHVYSITVEANGSNYVVKYYIDSGSATTTKSSRDYTNEDEAVEVLETALLPSVQARFIPGIPGQTSPPIYIDHYRRDT